MAKGESIYPKSSVVVAMATLFSIAVLVIGYFLLGLLPALLFGFGYVGGLVLWLLLPNRPPFRELKAPYLLTLALFVAHKIEERVSGFFPALSEITGTPISENVSFLGVTLYFFAGAWLLIPALINRGQHFGYFLAWTFFCAMGVTELAHFVFPLFSSKPYGYFPGMASVLLLAPLGWWGMWRLSHGPETPRTPS